MNRLPPGPPRRLFGLDAANRMRKDPLGYPSELAHTYGDLVYLRLGPNSMYLVTHPEAIREVLVTKAKSFRKLERMTRVFRQVDGNGLVISEGDFWLRQRRLIQTAFQPRKMGKYAETTVRYTQQLVDGWQDGAELNLADVMTHLTLQIIAKTLFDVEVADQVEKLREAVHILSETFVRELSAFFTLPDWLPLPGKRRKRWAIQVLDELIWRIIRERRASGEDRGDLLSTLLNAVDEEGGGRMTDQQVRDEAVTLFNAGHDSTAAALAWTWYVAARHPEVQEQLVGEVRQVLGERPATFEDVSRLRYTEQVIKETLRLYPPAVALFLRQAVTEVEVGGYVVPAGSWVYLFLYSTHHDPRWFPNPEQFDPGRFAPGRVEQIPPCAYLPFGAGPHICIGNNFALMEMVLIVTTVLQRFRLEPAPGQGEAEPEPLVALRPKGGVHLKICRRSELAPANLEK